MPVKRLRPRGLKTQKGQHTWEVRAGRRSCPQGGFAQLQEWTDGGSALASPCGRTGQTPRQRIQHSRRTYDFPDDFPQQLVRFQGGVVGGAEPPSRHPSRNREALEGQGCAAQHAAHDGAGGPGELAGP